MSKIEFSERQTRTRAEIQKEITPGMKKVFEDAFSSLNMAKDPDHIRRTVRAGLHVLAKMAMENGCPPSAWRTAVSAAWSKEEGEESLGEAIVYAETAAASA